MLLQGKHGLINVIVEPKLQYPGARTVCTVQIEKHEDVLDLGHRLSGDADGTMGGLVAQADPESFKLVFERALEAASWCSNDPVCMELGKDGQGVLGTNLAACHNCCLLPETSCQHFNQALDRAFLFGDTTAPSEFWGFFS